MWDRHELGECRPCQESIVRSLKISDLKLYSFRVEIFPSPEGHEESDLATPRTMPWKGAQLVRSEALDNPIRSKVFRKRMFKELPPSMRTWLSFTSLMMG
jgi:hypothetical protein